MSEALAGGDLDSCRPMIRASLETEESLRSYFQALLIHGALHPLENETSSGSQMHPVVALNSLKNLVSLRLEKPSETLVTLATQLALTLTPDPPDKNWRDVTPDSLAEPMFVMDLLQALEKGDRKKAFEEAARMSHLSDNEIYLMDILTEAAVREFPRLGLIGYGFHRAASFSKGQDLSPFSYRLLDAVSRKPVSPLFPGIPEGFRVDFFAGPVLKSGSASDVVLLATAERLWNLESMKRRAFRRAVVGWLGEMWLDVPQEEVPEPGSGKAVGNWVAVLEKGDTEAIAAGIVHARESQEFTWPVEVADAWLSQMMTENPFDFVLLDAVQHLAKVLPLKHTRLLADFLVSVSDQPAPGRLEGKS